MVSEYSDFKSDEFNDDIVLIDVMNAYNNMLKANDGFVSVGGVVALQVTTESEEQPLNAFPAILTIVFGNVMEVSFEQFRNAPEFMLVTALGSVTEDRL